MSKKEPSFDKICTIMQRNQRIAELERELMASKRAHDNTRDLWAKDKRDLAEARRDAYRKLQPHESIQAGDEWFDKDSWWRFDVAHSERRAKDYGAVIRPYKPAAREGGSKEA